MPPSAQDIPVLLNDNKPGLLSIEDNNVDVLQLAGEGSSESAPRPPPLPGLPQPHTPLTVSAPKRLLSCPARLILRARLAATNDPNGRARLDLHALRQKSPTSHLLRLTKIHVLVEQTHQADAEQWVNLVMESAYPGASTR